MFGEIIRCRTTKAYHEEIGRISDSPLARARQRIGNPWVSTTESRRFSLIHARRYNISHVAIGVGDLGLAYQVRGIAVSHPQRASSRTDRRRERCAVHQVVCFIVAYFQALKIAISVDSNHAESYCNLAVLEVRKQASRQHLDSNVRLIARSYHQGSSQYSTFTAAQASLTHLPCFARHPSPRPRVTWKERLH